MKTEIISATLNLADSFRRAVDVVARERRYLSLTEAFPLEQTQEFVSQILKNGWSQFFAVCDGEVVGWCDIIRNERPGRTHSGQLGIGIIPGHRGCGLGRKLMQAAVNDAFSKGIERIELEVFESNRRAIRLYESLGFSTEGRKIKARFFDDNYEDILLMALLSD